MKALAITLLTAFYFALISAAGAAIPARTPTPTPQTAAAGGLAGTDMAITVLFAAGIFLAGVVALVLVRRGGSA